LAQPANSVVTSHTMRPAEQTGLSTIRQMRTVDTAGARVLGNNQTCTQCKAAVLLLQDQLQLSPTCQCIELHSPAAAPAAESNTQGHAHACKASEKCTHKHRSQLQHIQAHTHSKQHPGESRHRTPLHTPRSVGCCLASTTDTTWGADNSSATATRQAQLHNCNSCWPAAQKRARPCSGCPTPESAVT
jgi:hypothetical protein